MIDHGSFDPARAYWWDKSRLPELEIADFIIRFKTWYGLTESDDEIKDAAREFIRGMAS